MTKRHLALFVWERELGIPYRWAGDDTIAGFDCSGLVLEGLKSVGMVYKDKYMTAEQLSNSFPAIPHGIVPKEGSLIFFIDQNNHIYHVEIVYYVIDGEVFTIGASGGGGKTTDIQTAIAQNAYVKIRPRKHWDYAVDPFSD